MDIEDVITDSLHKVDQRNYMLREKFAPFIALIQSLGGETWERLEDSKITFLGYSISYLGNNRFKLFWSSGWYVMKEPGKLFGFIPWKFNRDELTAEEAIKILVSEVKGVNLIEYVRKNYWLDA